MPLFKSGRIWNPYAEDSPSQKRRRLTEAEGVLTAAGFPEVAGALETAADFVSATGDQVVPGSKSLGSSFQGKSGRASRPNMGSRMRSGFRRRRKRRSTEKSRTFRRVVKWKESKNITLEPATATLTAGDATTRTLRLFSPWQVLTAGDGPTNRDGATIFARGFRVKLFFSDAAANTEDYDIIITYFKSVVLTDTTTGLTNLDDRGITYGNTTTNITNPTQGDAGIAGTVNMPMYEDATEPFVGSDPAAPYNPDIVTVIKKWRIPMRSHGVAGTQPFKTVTLWMPLNRIMTYENVEGTLQAGQFFSHGFQYYYSIAVVSASFLASTSLCTMEKNTTLYWKEW